ncbi:MAG TPA: lipoprotein [Cellvibrio sp.]|nr:lipoprotein [Cellvibrio sp.]
MKTAVALMLLCLGLGACGQKGPLFIPQPAKPQPEVKAPPAAPPAPEQPQEAASK